jgi:polysaccharide pyruvyl transferase WcaK-like protein
VNERVRRITLLGSSSGRNAGDAALIRAIVEGLRRELPGARFEIPTIAPGFLRRSYPADVVTPIPILPWNLSIRFFGVPTFRSVARTDATLVFDAILFDRSLRNPFFNHLWPLQFLLPYAKRCGKKVVFHDVGVGPVDTAAGREVLRRALATGDLFLIRDPDSLALAREVGLPPKPVHLMADAAFDHPPASATRIGEILRGLDLAPERSRVGVNVNAYLDSWASENGGTVDAQRFATVIAEVADRMVLDWHAAVVFFVTQRMDEPITRSVQARMKTREHSRILGNGELAPEELQGAMGEMAFFVGMRLHSLLLAASRETPIAGLVYQKKVESMLRYLELPESAVPMAPFEAESLWQRIDDRWRHRDDIRQRLSRRVAQMRELARESMRLTADLLRAPSNP